MLKICPNTINKPLKKGDEINVINVSSALNDERLLQDGINIFNEWGLKCQTNINQIIGRKWGYLSGDDLTRHKELYSKPNIPLTIFACGGWGAARILERPFPWQRGWFVGYSDVTSILLSRLSLGFHGGIHGPLMTSISKEPDWSKERLKSLLFGEPVPDLKGESWKKGIAKGPLVVANLTVASHLLGSSHIPDLSDAILILEDVGESPYRIDRMLTQWRLAGLLQKLAGIGFGNFKNCINDEDDDSITSFQLDEILQERCHDLEIPILGKLPVGHCEGNAALPQGSHALIDGNNGLLRIFPS